MSNLVRAWHHVFKLSSESRFPSFAMIRQGIPICGSCGQVMEELRTVWVQLNQLYLKIGRLRQKIQGTLQAAVEQEEAKRGGGGGGGVPEKIRRYQYQLIEELRKAEQFEVDEEALNLDGDQEQILSSSTKSPPTARCQENLENAADHIFQGVEIKLEPTDTDPEFPGVDPGENEPEWIPSVHGADSVSDGCQTRQSQTLNYVPPITPPAIDTHLHSRKCRSRLRPLSPGTRSKLVAEIKSNQRQVRIPLKRICWDDRRGRWIVPRLKPRSQLFLSAPQLQQRQRQTGRSRTRTHKLISQCIATEAEIYTCRIAPDRCTYRFDTALRRDVHELRRHQGDSHPFKCRLIGSDGTTECGQGFQSRSKLDSHQERRHPGGAAYVNKPSRLHCDQCNRVVGSEEALQRHKAKLHSEAFACQHLCTVCGKVMESRHILAYHMATHTRQQHQRQNQAHDPSPKPNAIALPHRFQCDSCPESFTKRIALRRHDLRIHKPEELTKNPEHCCRFCDKISVHKWVIRRHEILHHGVANINGACPPVNECTWPGCAYRTFGRRRFEIHEERHKNERKYRCSVEGCLAAYNYKHTLVNHMRVHTGERPFKCPYADAGCGSAFRTSGELSEHVKVVHEKKANVWCELCGKGFPVKKHLRYHLKKHHAS